MRAVLPGHLLTGRSGLVPAVVYISKGDATDTFYIELNDAPGQWILAEVGANKVLPFAATAISGGNVDSVKVLY
jgi:hypothetical protein